MGGTGTGPWAVPNTRQGTAGLSTCTARLCHAGKPAVWSGGVNPRPLSLERARELEATNRVTVVIPPSSTAPRAPTSLPAQFNYVQKGAPRLISSLCNVSSDYFLTLVVTVTSSKAAQGDML